MTTPEFKPMHYTRLHHGEIRRQMRDALEKFEPPASDLPPPTVTSAGLLTYAFPYPVKLAFDGLLEVTRDSGIAIAVRDDAAYSLTLASGTMLEFWPIDDNTSRLDCRGISDADDMASGQRLRELLGIVASLDRLKETLLNRTKAADLDARETALATALGPAAMADLAYAVAALKDAGLGVVVQTTANELFAVHVSRPLGYTQSFTSLDAFLAFARQVAPPAAEERQPQQPVAASGRRRAIITTARDPVRRGGGILTWLLLIAGLALLGLLFFYPLPF